MIPQGEIPNWRELSLVVATMIKLIAEKVYNNSSIVHMEQSNDYVERFRPFICSNSLGLQLSPVFRKSLSSLGKTDFFRIYTTERKVSLQFG